MTEPERPRLPQIEPHEARTRAEDCLGLGIPMTVDVSRAIAWGLLAVAGELALIRRNRR